MLHIEHNVSVHLIQIQPASRGADSSNLQTKATFCILLFEHKTANIREQLGDVRVDLHWIRT